MNATNHKIRVLIVDDSASVRQTLCAIIDAAPDMEVMATAGDPFIAAQRIHEEVPDVIVLDVEMPRMDGITFLRKIMAERPTPVIICSSLTEQGAETTMQALAAGAFAIFTKPSLGVKSFLTDASADLVAAVRAAAGARVAKNQHVSRIPGGDAEKVPPQAALPRPPARLSADAVLAPGLEAMAVTTDRFTAIGTSTGGTQALEFVLSSLPRTCPGLVVVQHMPEKFTAAFAQRLDRLCAIEVKEAATGDRVLPGRALIAPGGQHLVVKRSGAQYVAEVVAAPPVNRHCPSVDVLFRSCAKYAGRNAVGVIMTGMGDDGARGLLEMRQAGARTLAQDEESCVVFGMPKEAIKLGAVERVVELAGIPELIAR
jgi:two-component system chemotaxis response regulator CheB